MSDDEEVREDSLSRNQLKGAALHGVRWVVLARVFIETGALLGSVAVARLITPSQFGNAAPAAFFFAFACSLPNTSFGTVLIRAKELREVAVRTAFTLSLLTGVAITVITIALGPLLGMALPHEAVFLLQLMAPVYLIYSLGSVSQALIQRDLDFRRGSINDVISLLAGTIVTVVAAAFGLGGLSIVLGFLAQGTMSSAQVLYWRGIPRPGFDRAEARKIIAFGAPVTGSGVLYGAQRNAGLAILGARMPAAQVGFYWRASQLGIDYQGKISGILLKILLPLLSRARDIEDLRAVRARMVKVHCAAIFPFLTMLIVIAPTFIPWFYGEKWGPAAPAAQLLAVAGAVAVIGTGTGPLLMAVGRPDAALKINAIALVVFIAAVYVAAPYGLVATCATIVGCRIVSLFATQYFLVERLVGIPVRETVVNDVIPALGGCAGLAAVAFPIQLGLEAIGMPSLPKMVIVFAAGMLAYLLTLRVAFPKTWADVHLLFDRLGGAQVRKLRMRLRPAKPVGVDA
jgi:O-antigen/teichoic acid export membrane protein